MNHFFALNMVIGNNHHELRRVFFMTSPDLHFEMNGSVAIIRLNRPAKRNALCDALILGLRYLFETLPTEAKAAALHGAVAGGGLELASVPYSGG